MDSLLRAALGQSVEAYNPEKVDLGVESFGEDDDAEEVLIVGCLEMLPQAALHAFYVSGEGAPAPSGSTGRR